MVRLRSCGGVRSSRSVARLSVLFVLGRGGRGAQRLAGFLRVPAQRAYHKTFDIRLLYTPDLAPGPLWFLLDFRPRTHAYSSLLYYGTQQAAL